MFTTFVTQSSTRIETTAKARANKHTSQSNNYPNNYNHCHSPAEKKSNSVIRKIVIVRSL